jgi:competence protein CoiA
MLTAIRQIDCKKLTAKEANKADAPFICQCCDKRVSLRKGGVRSSHFAHFPPVTCEYGVGESEEHRRCKIEIYEHLINHPKVTKCEMERNLGTVRPDISAYINNVPVAIEVQLSTLSLEKIERRTADYASKGIYVLWLPKYQTSLLNRPYTPKPWERWLHALYYGRVYYWVGGLKILPFHFENYLIEINGRTKNYRKISKRYKLPVMEEILDLVGGFKAMSRDRYVLGNHNLLPAKLWIGPK